MCVQSDGDLRLEDVSARWQGCGYGRLFPIIFFSWNVQDPFPSCRGNFLSPVGIEHAWAGSDYQGHKRLPNTEMNMLANMTTFKEALRVIRSLRGSSSWSFDLLGASKLLDSNATVSMSFLFTKTCCTPTLKGGFASLQVDCEKFVTESTHITTATVKFAAARHASVWQGPRKWYNYIRESRP